METGMEIGVAVGGRGVGQRGKCGAQQSAVTPLLVRGAAAGRLRPPAPLRPYSTADRDPIRGGYYVLVYG